MRCSTLHGAAAQQSRAEAPLPPIAYVPPAVAPRAGGNAHLATHHQNLKAASNSTLPWPHPDPSVRGRPDGWRTRGAGLVLEASVCKTLASRQPLELQAFFDSVKQSSKLIC